MKDLKSLWKENNDYLQGLVKNYPMIPWESGSLEISDIPLGWRSVVEDVFKVLDRYARDGIYVYTPRNPFSLWFCKSWNAFASMIHLPKCMQFSFLKTLKNVQSKVYPKITISQIKEKFGGLRIYYSCDDKTTQLIISGVVDMAEQTCSHTCQISGAEGKLRGDGWFRVLSDEENLKYKKQKYGKA